MKNHIEGTLILQAVKMEGRISSRIESTTPPSGATSWRERGARRIVVMRSPKEEPGLPGIELSSYRQERQSGSIESKEAATRRLGGNPIRRESDKNCRCRWVKGRRGGEKKPPAAKK